MTSSYENRAWAFYLVGRPHTPINTIKHPEHFDYVPAPSTLSFASSCKVEEEEKEGGIRGKKRGNIEAKHCLDYISKLRGRPRQRSVDSEEMEIE